MFTGLVESTAAVRALRRQPGGSLLELEAPQAWDDVARGESICVSGVCLTAVPGDGTTLRFDVSAETLERSTLGALRPGDPVNLERALAVGARMGGHVVQGHVDATAAVSRLESAGGFWTLGVRIGDEWARYVVEKGSITVDGVSLTVVSVADDSFTVSLIPTTLAETTLGERRVGDRVNLEVDAIAKYVERLMQWRNP